MNQIHFVIALKREIAALEDIVELSRGGLLKPDETLQIEAALHEIESRLKRLRVRPAASDLGGVAVCQAITRIQ
ncbi:MAG TPA: hypothetical protein VL404_05995 [Candidatus Eisenbacteria bacterium]|jgi:hypothetical protein|nr:hypothetical protein [Candidatus Eisenbacteria bacterium]